MLQYLPAHEVLVLSQFTLAGDCAKGRRPGFDNATKPKEAESLYHAQDRRGVAS